MINWNMADKWNYLYEFQLFCEHQAVYESYNMLLLKKA